MGKPKYIYVITTLEVGYKYANRNRSADGAYHSFHKRTSKTQRQYLTPLSTNTIGWFSDLKEAQNSVASNDLDMHEQSNQYVLIEKLVEGPCSIIDEEQWWYKWHGPNSDKGKYKPCKPPEGCVGIIGYWNRTDRHKETVPRIEFDYILDSFSMVCAKEQFKGCCCSCKHHGVVHNHCSFTTHKKGKCTCSKELGFYVCGIPMVMGEKLVHLSGPHGYCEMYDELSKKDSI